MNWNWSTPDTEEKYSARCVITTKTNGIRVLLVHTGQDAEHLDVIREGEDP